MNSYLSLVPISAKVRRRQNRMTILCIVFAVFLVTGIFSMADMAVRMEQTRLLEKHGSLALEQMFLQTTMQTVFITAGVLFLVVLAAGVMMIASTINTGIDQRTRFFGMMRCIGMSPKQLGHLVRMEALYWCKTAIPLGVLMGVAATWGLCAILRFAVGEEFTQIPLFGVSALGIGSGVVMGLCTVLLAARAPARRAARVSPVAAVSGNAGGVAHARRAANTCAMHIETALGVQHAMESKKNLLLMTGSFVLSIVLFLSFSALVELVGYVMPQSSSAADVSVWSANGGNTLDSGLKEALAAMPGVTRAYGRRSALDVPAVVGASDADTLIDLVSYDDYELRALIKDGVLRRGSNAESVCGDSRYVLATWDTQSALGIGDAIRVGEETLEIAGLLKYDPFSADGLTHGKVTLITSDETLARLTGERGYALLMAQTTGDVTEAEIGAMRGLFGESATFRDERDAHTTGTYRAFTCCVYGFLAIIILVAALHVVNSIAMSVSARTKQYGAMRAVGMSSRQVTRMIAAEALTYALAGYVAGCAAGLLLQRWLYAALITSHYPFAVWELPVGALAGILVFVAVTVAVAVYGPAKRMRGMSITRIIGEG